VRSVRSSGTGDLIVRVEVETPVKLTEAQKDLLRKFDELVTAGGEKHNPRARSWFDAVRTFFEKLGA
jgi:molecular chaperone DnaJ